MDPEKKSLNFIFPTKYVIPKSLNFSHWLSENIPYMDPKLQFPMEVVFLTTPDLRRLKHYFNV